MPFGTEWCPRCVPSWPGAHGYREFGRAWFPGTARTWCIYQNKQQIIKTIDLRNFFAMKLTQSTRRRTVAPSPARGSPRAPGSVESTLSCCGARGQRWRCRNRWVAHLYTWHGAPHGSAKKSELTIMFNNICLVSVSFTFLWLYDVVYSESTNRIFSGFKSVCVKRFSCRNLTE